MGSESYELAAASKLEDDVEFYQTANPDVAKLFHIDSEVKQPALVMIKKDAEIHHFSSEFTKSNVAEFVTANKFPLVINLTQQTAQQVFENPIKKQLILFATSEDSEKFLPIFKETAKQYKGKVVSVYVQLDNEEVGQQVSEYFGVRSDAPSVLAYTGNEDSRKFLMDGEISLTNIKSFAEKFLEDNLKPFYKSDPIPETNEGDVKVVVGNNFDEIVLNESKDVLLEIYAPWCGHCQALEPTYNKLAKHLRGIDSLVIAKMDGSTNEHPRAKADGFPTILFFPAGNKSFDPMTVDTDRTVVAFYKFLKKHASIPFKLQKPAKEEKAKDIDARKSQESESRDSKDEL
ncbi:chaperone [Lithospermum erythrorhizon]|uniref:protein disulfide-isomerase n=1 Tax=Lithospermum erythrorhizon TaxID=34254 RepID=A0AAV3R5I1_LITER